MRLKAHGQVFILKVQGTAAEPVTFTSPSSVVDSWKGLRFEGTRADGTDIVIDHAIIEYADKALFTNSAGAKVTVTNSTVRYNNYGVYVDGAYQQAQNHPVISFTSGALYSNAEYHYYTKNFYGTAITTIDATGNWWGTDDISAIQATIFDLQDGNYKPLVDYRELLTSESGPVLPGTHMMGFIMDEVELSVSDAVFLNPIKVMNGATLTVTAGTTVSIPTYDEILIQSGGKLFVQGTSASPVTFTSPLAVEDSWKGLRFEGARTDGSGIVIDHAIIEYADKALYTNSAGMKATVTNSTVRYNNYGVYIDAGYQQPQHHPIITFSSGALHDNLDYHFYTKNFYGTDITTLNATGNWWGTSDVGDIQASIFDIQDGAYKPLVDFRGLLTTQNGSTVSGTHLMGPIQGRVEWAYDDAVILDDITIRAGSELVIHAGSDLQFYDGTQITIESGGNLSVYGSNDLPVVMTSASTTKSAGDWNGITVQSNSDVRLVNTVIEYADIGVKFEGVKASGRIHNSVIQHNNTGIHVNAQYQALANHPVPVVTNNIIRNNINYNYYTERFGSAISRTLNAKGNYWGTVDAVAIGQSVYDNTDSSSSPIVDVDFYRASEASIATADAGDDVIGFGTVETQLNGSASSNVGITSYQWEQLSGETVTLNSDTTQTASFTSPDVSGDIDKSFLFTITDANDISASDAVDVVIKPYSAYNQAPVVDASTELLVFGGEAVSVSLNAVDNDGDALSYTWTQTGGEAVTLQSTDTDTLAFTAPTPSKNTVFGFKLTVTDNNYVVERTVTIAVKGFDTASGTYYYHNDHLGTPQVMTDSAATVVWEASYSPFGEVDLLVNQITNNLRFAGQYYDQETGHHYNYFRDYDPELGRYIQSDPIGLAGGINTYAYGMGNPVKYTDPYGLYVFGYNVGGGFTVGKVHLSGSLALATDHNGGVILTGNWDLGWGSPGAGGFARGLWGGEHATINDLEGPGFSTSLSGGIFSGGVTRPLSVDECYPNRLDGIGNTIYEFGFATPGPLQGTITGNHATTLIRLENNPLADIGRKLGGKIYDWTH